MTRRRNIEIRQINISMHAPHSPQAYVDLFQKSLRMQRVFTRGKADGYLLGTLYDAKSAVENNELQGEIYRFTSIDPNAPWFNTQTGKPAEDDETDEIVIPPNLQPNLERIPFIFRPKEHRFWYISKDRNSTLGPSVAESFLQKLFDEATNKHNLPQVEVTVIPDEAAVDEVMSIHRITKIIFEFKRPNPDDASGVERQIMERMARRNVDRLNEEMTSRDPSGIIPDQEMKLEAQAAANNGYVEAKGYDAASRPVSESTKAKPARYVEVVNGAIETAMDVLARFGAKNIGRANKD